MRFDSRLGGYKGTDGEREGGDMPVLRRIRGWRHARTEEDSSTGVATGSVCALEYQGLDEGKPWLFRVRVQ